MLMKPRGRLTGEGEWEIAREAKGRSRENSSFTQRNRPATPRGGVLAALGGGKSGLAPPTPLLATRQCPSAFCPLEFPDASAAGRATPELLLSHCTAISFPRQGCLPAFGRRGHQGPERGVSLPGVTQGSQTRACSLPLGLGRLVCAQAEDAQRKSGTHKDIHLRC